MERQLLILADCKGRVGTLGILAVIGDYVAIVVYGHQPDVGAAAAGLQDVYPNALALYPSDLGHHLQPVPSGGESPGCNQELAVGGAAFADGLAPVQGVVLVAVNRQAHDLVTAATHRPWNGDGLAVKVSAVGEAVGKVVARGQANLHHAHTLVGLFRLALGVAGLFVHYLAHGLHIHIHCAGLHRAADVYCVGTGGHLVDGALHRDCRSSLHRDGDGGLGAVALPIAVEVVVLVGQRHMAAFFHLLGAHIGTEADTAEVCRATPATGGRERYRYVGAVLSAKHQVVDRVALAVFTLLHLRVGNHSLLEFRQSWRHGAIRHSVAAGRVKRLVHLHRVNGDVHLPLAVFLELGAVHLHARHHRQIHRAVPVGRYTGAVHAQATQTAATAVVFPQCLRQPVFNTRAGELLARPLAVGIERYATPRLAFPRRYRRYRRSQVCLRTKVERVAVAAGFLGQYLAV